jgi:hypothetical protein
MNSKPSNVRRAISPMRWASRFVEQLCHQETVQQGPFAGMRLSHESSFTSIRPLLLGTYEMELWPYIQQAIGISDGAIVVGAAEGYYAVGLAKLLGCKKVIAFEMDPNGRRVLQKNAEKNQVEQQLEIYGKCDAPALRTAIKRFSRPFIIIDVEGAEAEILTGQASSTFDHVIFLIEIHDFVDKSLGEIICAQFRETHTATEIWQQTRCFKDLPRSLHFRQILWRWYRTLLSESRPERMRWLFLTPKKDLGYGNGNGHVRVE